MDRLANMQAFDAVGQTGSFAEAARKLGVANSVVSKRIKDLENYLTTQLVTRTTRKVALTEAGTSYLECVRRILNEIEEAESRIRGIDGDPVGVIRVAAPLSFAVQYLGPAFSRYLDKYPNVDVRTYLSDRFVDIIGEGYDLVIRAGELEDSALVARKLVTCRRVVSASPEYLQQFGTPLTPADLQQHNCLNYINLNGGKSWPFLIDGQRISQSVNGRFASDNGDLLHQATVSGCGISLLPTFIIGDSIRRGKLKVLLEDFELDEFNVYAIFQRTRHPSAKVRTLIDHLVQELEALFLKSNSQ